jgi:Glycosyl transferases group 1
MLRILYVNCASYDYMTATLVEGLTELGHDVMCSRASNGGKAIAAAEIPGVAHAADLIIVGSNRGVDTHLLRGVENPRIVAVDGGDNAQFEVPTTIRFKAIFKRELCPQNGEAAAEHVYPLPFAAEKRYFTAPRSKDVLVSFVANMATNPLRNSIHVRLLNKKHPGIISGSTKERSYSVPAPQANAIETPIYRDLLARSWISVSVPGLGYDCARFWGILAARSMLFTYTPDIVIPNGFTDGVNAVMFSSIPEFEQKLDYYLANPAKVAEIAEAGHRHLLAHHTTAHRAAYFLEVALPAVQRPGSCDRFYRGPE